MKTFLYFSSMLLIAFSSCKKDPVRTYPTEDLVSYFNFDDNLNDKQGYAQSGTAKFTYVAGKKGKALQFNGIDQLVDFIPVNPQNHTVITLAVWVKTNEASGLKYFLFGSNFGMLTSSGKIGVVIINPGTSTVFSNAFSPGTWTHVVGTFDGTNIKIYINGQWVATQNHPGNILGYSSMLTLGSYDDSYWAGVLDELYIYKRVLTDAEIQALYKL